MPELLSVPVVSKNGLRGKVLTSSTLLDDAAIKSVVFESGRELSIGSEHFHLRKDGTYFLDLSVDPDPKAGEARNVSPVAEQDTASSIVTAARPDSDSIVIPRVEEQAVVTRRIVETGRVRVTKTVTEHPVTIDEPTIHHEYKIDRVPVNRAVTQMEGPRVEGETTIIPVYDEEIVTTKRLILREEIHMTKSQREEHAPRTLVLRRENIEVVRTPGDVSTHATGGTVLK